MMSARLVAAASLVCLLVYAILSFSPNFGVAAYDSRPEEPELTRPVAPNSVETQPSATQPLAPEPAQAEPPAEEDDETDRVGQVMAALVGALGQSSDDSFREDILDGIGDALAGQKRSPKPAGWDEIYPGLQKSHSQAVRRRADELALVFQDQRAVRRLQGIAGNQRADSSDRQWALDQLVGHHVPKLTPFYIELLDDPLLRIGAIRGLASSGRAETTAELLLGYPSWNVAERQAAIAVLASRIASANQLVKSLQAEEIAAVDISSFHVRQMRSLGDKQLNKQLDQLWGAVRESSAARLAQIEQWKRRLNAKTLSRGDLDGGAKLFKTNCATCHRLRGEGAKIGPDLTGSNRDNLHYLLENIVDPSAAVANDYRLTHVQTEGGRVLSGIARAAPSGVIRLTTPEGELLIPPDDVYSTKQLATSMMPDGLLDKLSKNEVRDLIAFLMMK